MKVQLCNKISGVNITDKDVSCKTELDEHYCEVCGIKYELLCLFTAAGACGARQNVISSIKFSDGFQAGSLITGGLLYENGTYDTMRRNREKLTPPCSLTKKVTS